MILISLNFHYYLIQKDLNIRLKSDTNMDNRDIIITPILEKKEFRIRRLQLGALKSKDGKFGYLKVKNPEKDKHTIGMHGLFYHMLNLTHFSSKTALKLNNLIEKYHDQKVITEEEVHFLMTAFSDSLILNILSLKHILHLEGLVEFFTAKVPFKEIDLNILKELYKLKITTPNKLCEKMKIRRNDFFKSINKLIKIGLIKEEKKDKRGYYISAVPEDFKRKFYGLTIEFIELSKEHRYQGIRIGPNKELHVGAMKDIFENYFKPFSIMTGEYLKER